MRYGIFSDIHSNLEALDAVINAYQKESIDKYLCVGDVVGYAANPKECIEKTKSLVMATVAGNHDWAAVSLFSVDYFNPYAREAIFWTRNNLDNSDIHFLKSLRPVFKADDLTLVHGTLNEPQDFNYLTDSYVAAETFKLMETDVCFVGHTHVAGVFARDAGGNLDYYDDRKVSVRNNFRYIVNVGSVGQPRDGNPKSAYCIYDTEKKEIQIKRTDYDIAAARKKIIEAGLPRFLADRLLSGR